MISKVADEDKEEARGEIEDEIDRWCHLTTFFLDMVIFLCCGLHIYSFDTNKGKGSIIPLNFVLLVDYALTVKVKLVLPLPLLISPYIPLI